jgi:hypothetical protein
VKLREGLASVLYEAERLRVKCSLSTFGVIALRVIGIKHGIESWIVVHLELPIELEAAAVLEDILPELGEAAGEIVALLGQHGQPFAVALAVLRRGAVELLGGVKDLEREDGEAVDD